MRKNVYSVATSVLLISTVIAHSQDLSQDSPQESSQNWYVTGDAGPIFQQPANFRQATPIGYGTSSATFNPGVRTDVKVGYTYGDPFAAELETGFMWNSVDKIGGASLSSVGQSIDFYSVPILANVTCKFTTQCGLDPYFGIGAGGVISFFQAVPSGNNDTDIEPAFQLEAGLKYQLAPNAAIGIAYKFLASVDQRYYSASFQDHVTISGVYIHGVFANFTVNF